jgi:N-acetylneuraminic acid mutarotase
VASSGRKQLGQAKDRGTEKERIAGAIQRLTIASPPVIVCNGCKTSLSNINEADTSRLKGIEIAFSAHCDACDQDTWAVRGEIAAVKAFYAALEKASGQKIQLGTAKPKLAS